jgi:hypothetical protein
LWSVLVLIAFFCLFFLVLALAIAVSVATAFAPVTIPKSALSVRAASMADEVDQFGNNVAVKSLLEKAERQGILTQVAQSGLLSKAQAAGLTLSKLEPLLAIAASNKDVLILVEAAGPELLPILPKVVELAPAALPLAAQAIGVPPIVLQGLGLASLGAAVAAVVIIPDDTIVEVAAQTLAVGVLGVAAPAASFIGAAILSKIFK